jgi:hypothetical protein
VRAALIPLRLLSALRSGQGSQDLVTVVAPLEAASARVVLSGAKDGSIALWDTRGRSAPVSFITPPHTAPGDDNIAMVSCCTS